MTCLRACYLRFNSPSCDAAGGWWRPGLGPWNTTEKVLGQQLGFHGIFSSCQQCSQQSLQPKMYTQSLIIQCESCGAGQFNSGSAARLDEASGGFVGRNMSCHACPAGDFSGSGAARCRPCPPGHIAAVGQTECLQCADGQYAADDGVKCRQCPFGAQCVNGQVHPQPGFWGSSTAGSHISMGTSDEGSSNDDDDDDLVPEHSDYVFLPCPPGYCCTAGQGLCNASNMCLGHRNASTPMCGTCGSGAPVVVDRP